jgi:hypothetical protein
VGPAGAGASGVLDWGSRAHYRRSVVGVLKVISLLHARLGFPSFSPLQEPYMHCGCPFPSACNCCRQLPSRIGGSFLEIGITADDSHAKLACPSWKAKCTRSTGHVGSSALRGSSLQKISIHAGHSYLEGGSQQMIDKLFQPSCLADCLQLDHWRISAWKVVCPFLVRRSTAEPFTEFQGTACCCLVMGRVVTRNKAT